MGLGLSLAHIGILTLLSHRITNRIADFTKRSAKCDIILETSEATWKMSIQFHVVPEKLFKKKFPTTTVEAQASPTTDAIATESPYSKNMELENIKTYSDSYSEWLTMEATLPPCTASDCLGHFPDLPNLAHSVMLNYNSHLAGKAISSLTGVDLPFNREVSPLHTRIDANAVLYKDQ